MRFSYADKETRSILDCSSVLDYSDNPSPEVWIHRVSVLPKHRRKGIGTRLLKECCADADKEGITLLLSVEPDYSDNGMTFPQLVEWYEKHGFRSVRKPYGIMRREPIKVEG